MNKKTPFITTIIIIILCSFIIGTLIILMIIQMKDIFRISSFVSPDDSYKDVDKEKSDPWAKMTFCEKIVESKRMVSSSFPVPELDTMPDEYYVRGITSAPINFEGKFPEAKLFKGKITEATKNGPNFAGHFTVAEWGCGSTCQNHAVIDNETGEIIAYGFPSQYGVKFNIESKLLVTNPKENFPSQEEKMSMTPIQAAQTFASIERRYYRLVEYESSGESYLLHFCTESAGSHYLNQ